MPRPSDDVPDGRVAGGGDLSSSGCRCDLHRGHALSQLLFPPSNRGVHNRGSSELGLSVRVSRGSLVASNLSAVARERTHEAVGRRDELARLFDLSRDVLMMTESREALPVLARSIARRFDLDFVAVAVPRYDDWEMYEAGAKTIELDRHQLSHAFAVAQTTLEFDAYARTYTGHQNMTVDGQVVRLVPLRVGTKPIGVLAAAGRPVEAGTLDTLAGVVAIAIERAQFLEERKASELTRQSER